MHRYEAIADVVGLAVLAGEVIAGIAVISRWTADASAARIWYAIPLEFLISYSVLSLSAKYLWQRHRTLRPATPWLAFTALSSIFLLVGSTYVRVGGVAGMFLGVASVARSLVLQAGRP